MKNPPIIWALVDDRAGNTSQVLGVAEAFELPFIIKNINYNRLGRVSNFIKGRTLLGLTLAAKKEICPPWPDIVVSVASRMESTALSIKKQNPKTKLVHIQKPRLPMRNFDIIATPEHDFFGQDNIPSNVLTTLGAPNRITPKTLAEGQAKWGSLFEHLPRPHIAVLVGGSTNKADYTKEHAVTLVNKIADLCQELGGSLLVTTSRRTPPEVVTFLQQELPEPKYFYNAQSAEANPYAGLLACSDIIIASGDSISMCSEACSTGKPVYIYSPQTLTPPKYRYFQRRLIDSGYAVMLGDKWQHGSYEPLSDAKVVARFVLG